MSCSLPSNATLTLIEGEGFSEDYDGNEGPDTTRWEGALEVYLSQELITRLDGERLDETVRGLVYMPEIPALTIEQGDTLTMTHRGETIERQVRNVRVFDEVGLIHLTLYPT